MAAIWYSDYSLSNHDKTILCHTSGGKSRLLAMLKIGLFYIGTQLCMPTLTTKYKSGENAKVVAD